LSSIGISISGDATLSNAADGTDLQADGIFSVANSMDRLVPATGEESIDSSFPVVADGSVNAPSLLALFEGTGTTQLVFNFFFADGSGTVSMDNVPGTLIYNFTPTSAVPEPASIALLGVAMAGLGFVKWRRAA
jgi:PEP-CTERM motif-containing protein